MLNYPPAIRAELLAARFAYARARYHLSLTNRSAGRLSSSVSMAELNFSRARLIHAIRAAEARLSLPPRRFGKRRPQ